MNLSENAEHKYISAIPNPEYLIKSIAEQGYTLESAIADLADNPSLSDYLSRSLFNQLN